ncbi:MAG: NYN domain-containing protein [Candidatus Handelsmanbacteria bacterium]|nr:NYN domain-containing protein [Candidatus Handelsmanbacteria bacterium]
MGEHLLVDGYNLIKTSALFSHYERTSLQRARQALVQALNGYARQRGARVTLFFDGGAGQGEPAPAGPVQVVFSRVPLKADDLIKEAVQERHGARDLRVISTDREVARFAQRHRVRVTGAGAFERELAQPPPRPQPLPAAEEKWREVPLSEAQIAEWERIFQREKRIFDDPEGKK